MTRDHADETLELLDAGDGRRLERFGEVIVDRPAPTAHAPRRDPAAWRSADLRFDADRGWTGQAARGGDALIPWTVRTGDLTVELRPTSSGGVGLYPEHLANAAWLSAEVRGRRDGTAPSPAVLNLFAHTGLLTLAAAHAGAAVAHVDAARNVVAWARRNAELSGLADRPIRWLVDDATTFVAREARRGRRYDGIVLDPPSFGHAERRRWRLADGLPELLEACSGVLAPDGFMLLTAHTTGLGGRELGGLVQAALPAATSIAGSSMDLSAASGAELRLGWSLRIAVGR